MVITLMVSTFSLLVHFSLLAEEKKNQHAVMVVETILDSCTWINIHTLPVRTPTITITPPTIILTITPCHCIAVITG